MAADLDTLITVDIPTDRQNLLESFSNLEHVADYCENNYYQCENKRAALEETKAYTTQSLASVAYQINTLAFNFLQALDLQAVQLGEMESQVNHITQTVGIHKEKVARREIGVLTTNKSAQRNYKIIAPATNEKLPKYFRKPIDFDCLDGVGHGVRISSSPKQQQQQLQYQQQQQMQRRKRSTSSPYAPGIMGSTTSSNYGSIGNVSNNSAGPAPTTKPPTPPQQGSRYSTGTLNRSKDYRTSSVVAPPQVPSNYAPNYPMMQYGQQQAKNYNSGNNKTYGNLQVQMVHPVQQPHDMDPYGRGMGRGLGTLPRLSSASMRSASSHSSAEFQPGLMTSTLGRPPAFALNNSGLYGRQQTPPGSIQEGTLPSQYMARPSQRPPSPPLPPPPPNMQNSYGVQGYTTGPQPSNVTNAGLGQLSRQNSSQHEPPISGWVPKNYLEKVSAIYDYTADKDDELSFQEGSIIYVLKKNDDGWWEGIMDGVTGLFPGNYVEASL